MFNVNHSIKVNEIISTEGDQIAIADEHEIWKHDIADIRHGQFETVGDATIRIISGCDNTICTNMNNIKGVVCFLPKEYKGCAILKVKITQVFNKSVKAIPIDYIKSDKPIDWYCYGMEASSLLQEIKAFPNIKRVEA